MHGEVARAAELGQLPAGPPLRGGQPDLAGVILAGPVDRVGDDRDDGERQPQLPGHQVPEHAQDDDRDENPQFPDPHPRVGGQLGQAAPGLADGGLRIARGLPAGLTTGFHSGFGGSARPAERSTAGGSPPEGSRVDGSPGGRLLRRTLGGRRPVPQRQVGRFGFGRRGLRPVASPGHRSCRLLGCRLSAVAASSAESSRPAHGRVPDRPSRTGPEPPAASVLLGPWARRNRHRAGPSGAPSASFPCDRAPSCAARCDCFPPSADLMTYFSASATPSGISHHLSVTAIGLSA